MAAESGPRTAGKLAFPGHLDSPSSLSTPPLVSPGRGRQWTAQGPTQVHPHHRPESPAAVNSPRDYPITAHDHPLLVRRMAQILVNLSGILALIKACERQGSQAANRDSNRPGRLVDDRLTASTGGCSSTTSAVWASSGSTATGATAGTGGGSEPTGRGLGATTGAACATGVLAITVRTILRFMPAGNAIAARPHDQGSELRPVGSNEQCLVALGIVGPIVRRTVGPTAQQAKLLTHRCAGFRLLHGIPRRHPKRPRRSR